MNICYNCDTLQENYNNLHWKYNSLLDKYYDLEKKYNKTYYELDSAKFIIQKELEPRIKNEQRSYDGYVLNGGGDKCYQNGMSGNCGYECSIFGEKPECFENVTTKEQILEIYEDYTNTGYILGLIKEYGLQEKAKEIDKNILRKQMGMHQREIDKLYKELLSI